MCTQQRFTALLATWLSLHALRAFGTRGVMIPLTAEHSTVSGFQLNPELRVCAPPGKHATLIHNCLLLWVMFFVHSAGFDFFRDGFMMGRLTLRLLCAQGWLQTPHSPISTLLVLGLPHLHLSLLHTSKLSLYCYPGHRW